MTGKHTPGPWVVGESCHTVGRLSVNAATGRPLEICMCHWVDGFDDPEDEAPANARLIAAAPDLLAAAQEALACLADLGGDESPVPMLRAAIAKAGGSDA